MRRSTAAPQQRLPPWADCSVVSCGRLISDISTEAVKAKLAATTQEALDRGVRRLRHLMMMTHAGQVFGAPTIFVNGEMYFGSDRFALIAHQLGLSRVLRLHAELTDTGLPYNGPFPDDHYSRVCLSSVLCAVCHPDRISSRLFRARPNCETIAVCDVCNVNRERINQTMYTLDRKDLNLAARAHCWKSRSGVGMPC